LSARWAWSWARDMFSRAACSDREGGSGSPLA
jgi:hypothetical protein